MSSMSVSTIDGGHYLQARKSVQIVLPQPSADTQDSSVDTNDWLAALRKGVKSAMACLLGWRRSSNKRGPASNMTIKEKIHPRYLEFEPLCCLSSCLVRGGCYSVVAFEVLYVVVTSFVIALKIHDGGRMDFWDDLDTLNYNAIVTHQVSLYLLALFDLVTLGMALSLTFGLVSFQRIFIKIHWRFDFFSLAFNIVEFILYIFALSSEGPETWSWKNVLLVISFACQIPLQIWAITVVKSCYDFYVLLYVFVTLTEK